MTSSWTVQQVADRIVELDLVAPDVPAQKLSPKARVKTLDYFGTPDHHAVLMLLQKLGIVHVVDWKDFRGACEGGQELYEDLLAEVAAGTGGQVAITDIELTDEAAEDEDGDDEQDEEHVLRFRCNGEPQEWRIAHCEDEADEDMEAQLTFGTSVGMLVPAGSRQRWCHVTSEADGEPLYQVFADPDALGRLGTQFGLTFD